LWSDKKKQGAKVEIKYDICDKEKEEIKKSRRK